MIDIKILEKELDTSFKECIKSKWQTSKSSYYAGQIKIVEMLGYKVVTSNGNLKLYENGGN